MGRASKNSEESSGNNNNKRKSRSKAKKEEVVQSNSSKPTKQPKHQKDRIIRSLPISIQKSLVRVRECESQGASPTPESDMFYQQNSRPSGLKFKNPNFQVLPPFQEIFMAIFCGLSLNVCFYAS